ncbi:hypothetical protein K439DRAFT_1412174 [Ramaria rubella]|nr:hypothetical protein K439DRAFT_1412174 [Ramaria rubella]
MMSSSTSSIIESQILHTTTTRTLHAHNFNKSSTQATHALSDALSRYLMLLAGTCARYAQHAGRTGVTVRDALAALEDIGVGIDELREYVEGEAKELVRYTGQTPRRAEELAELRATVSQGLSHDHTDTTPLIYSRIPDSEEWPSESEDGGDVYVKQPEVGPFSEETHEIIREKDIDLTFDVARAFDPYADPPSSPHLPPSPISPPHARKRARTSNWKPPEHIPDFLPPFPGHAASPQLSPTQETAVLRTESTSLRIEPKESLTAVPLSIPLASTAHAPPLMFHAEAKPQHQSQRPLRPPSPSLPTSSSNSSSYLTSIPYELSSLSSVPEWHLPKAPPTTSPLAVTSTLPALLSSHSYLQSSSLTAPALQPPNPLRHGLAMMLLGLSSRAYSPAATLFASSSINTCAPLPHRAAPLATHAVPLDKSGKANFSLGAQKGMLPVPPPEWHARSAGGPVAIVDTTAVQGSRIPTLARTVLSVCCGFSLHP